MMNCVIIIIHVAIFVCKRVRLVCVEPQECTVFFMLIFK